MRTIFKKQLFLYMGTLIVSFVFLGAVLSQGIRAYFTERQVAYLEDAGHRIASSLDGFGSFGVFDLYWLYNQVAIMHQFYDARFIVIDKDYNVVIASSDLTDSEKPVHIKELNPLMNGQIVVLNGNMNGLFKTPLLTVGYPLRSEGMVWGAILINSSLSDLDNTIAEMYRMTLLCLTVSALIASIPIYFSCRALSKPLKQMNDAAKVIANGDFEKRIKTRSKDEVGQLAENFNLMAESLQEQEKIRRTYIANLSHDLRSPLTSMRGFLKAMEDGTIPEEKQPYYLGIVLDESDRLIKLSNDILDLHLIQEPALQLQISEFDINHLIRETVLRFENRALNKGLRVISRFAHESDLVSADYDKIQRVLYNLIDNAVKFVPEAGEITIETTVTGKKVTIGVQDNGSGLPLGEEKRIFDRFYKADSSRSEDRRGSGLGLSIVKEFVHAHGETVEVHSEPGKGCLFTFTLPLAE